MVKKLKSHISKTQGFTLIEVMIALAIFAVFIVAFTSSQGYNLADSTRMKEELMFRNLAEQKMNEIIISPPEFKDAITLTEDKGKFEDNEEYSYEVSYKRVKLDVEKLMNSSPQDEGEETQASAAEKKITSNITKNLKELIWQVEVRIISANSGNSFSVSGWLYNNKAKILFDSI